MKELIADSFEAVKRKIDPFRRLHSFEVRKKNLKLQGLWL
jgi:hypothetical protein